MTISRETVSSAVTAFSALTNAYNSPQNVYNSASKVYTVSTVLCSKKVSNQAQGGYFIKP